MVTITWTVLLVIFISTLISLIVVKVKDSNNKLNNGLLIFYFAVSLWISAGIGGIFTQVYSTVTEVQVVAKSPGASKRRHITSSSKKSSTGHYYLILWGLIVLSGVYVIRRPEWAGMVVDGLAAWKGKDLDRDREMLIQHAISNPKDREWVQAFLVDIETKRIKKEEPEEEDDIEIAPPDGIPK